MLAETNVRTDLQQWILPQTEVISPEDGVQALVERGYNPEHEAARARLLYQELADVGLQIAKYEQVNNREAYRREFLEDEPVSRPRIYWHFGGEMYSYPLQHDLVKVSSGIHPDERDGMTLSGFQKYEQIVAEEPSSPDNITLWYSPAGPGGAVAPFNKLHYEAGRLYAAFKLTENSSVHFDIKIQEGDDLYFPIKDALSGLSGRSETDLYRYLQDPFTIASIDTLERGIDTAKPVYVSRRKSTDAETHTWGEVMKQIKAARQYVALDGATPALDQSRKVTSDEARYLSDSSRINRSYWGEIQQFGDERGLEYVMLYGCSTTSVVGLRRYDPAANHATQFSSEARLSDVTSSTSEAMDNDHSDGKIACPSCKKEVSYKKEDGMVYCLNSPLDSDGKPKHRIAAKLICLE